MSRRRQLLIHAGVELLQLIADLALLWIAARSAWRRSGGAR